MLAFIESGVYIYVLAALAAIGTITKLAAAVRYSRLEHHAENVGLTGDTYIRLWKNKFENAYRINKGMNDPELFVERCINQSKLLGLQLSKWDRLNRVLCSVCLVLSAVAVTVEVRGGIETALILDHFLTSLSICSLMVFIEVFCETGEKRQRIGLNMTEYFVNTLSQRLKNGVEMVTDTGRREPRASELKSERRSIFHRSGRRDGFDGADGLQEEDELTKDTDYGRESAFSGEGTERDRLFRQEERRDKEREQQLRESLERIAASREPEESRREKRSRAKREEDVRLIEEILREYLN